MATNYCSFSSQRVTIRDAQDGALVRTQKRSCDYHATKRLLLTLCSRSAISIFIGEIVAKSLSEDEAYLAMFAFIEKRYRLTQSDDIGSFLSDMSLRFSGGTADPALQDDWTEAVELARAGEVDAMQRLRKR